MWSAAATLREHLRVYAQVEDSLGRSTHGWVYPSLNHLLLDKGRFFAPGPLPHGIVKLSDRRCYENAAMTAASRADLELLYADGFALFATGTGSIAVPHAWCVTPDGTVVDPTWDHGAGLAYLGVAVADPSRWPTDGNGFLANFHRCLPLLRDGVPEGLLADIGASLSSV